MRWKLRSRLSCSRSVRAGGVAASCSSGRILAAHIETVFRDLGRQRLRMMQRRSRTIFQAVDAFDTIALKPLVADLAAYPEASTHHRKWLRVVHSRHHKAQPFFHGAGLSPNHRQGPPRRSVDLSPMSPVYSVTHLAGLDHPNPLPASGERESPSRIAE